MAIALSNLDGLGFTRGVTINEFSADAEMTDVRDESVPTEQAVSKLHKQKNRTRSEWCFYGWKHYRSRRVNVRRLKPNDRKSDPRHKRHYILVELLTVNNIDATTTDTDNPTVNTLSNINGTVNVNGTVTHVGDTTTTGDVTQTGDNTVTGDVTVNGKLNVDSVEIDTNYITTTDSNSDLNYELAAQEK